MVAGNRAVKRREIVRQIHAHPVRVRLSYCRRVSDRRLNHKVPAWVALNAVALTSDHLMFAAVVSVAVYWRQLGGTSAAPVPWPRPFRR